jgi:hypothetical protein
MGLLTDEDDNRRSPRHLHAKQASDSRVANQTFFEAAFTGWLRSDRAVANLIPVTLQQTRELGDVLIVCVMVAYENVFA